MAIKIIPLPTFERVKELLHYNPDLGVFTWLANKIGVKAGRIAGCKKDNGYIAIRIDGTLFFAHRLAWLYMTGEAPSEIIDHIDGDRSNNKFSNLREATQKQNSENHQRLLANNTSGYRGVYYQKQTKKWVAQIGHRRKTYNLGSFLTPEDAARRAMEKRAELFTHNNC
jgi:hypothetical protein